MIISDLLNRNNYIRLAGLFLIIASALRIINKRAREDEIKILRLPSIFQYIIILCEFVMGVLLLILYETRLVLFINLAFIALGTIILFINNTSKILCTLSNVWALQPMGTSFMLHIYIMIFLILLLYP
jgi:hypothetical protein